MKNYENAAGLHQLLLNAGREGAVNIENAAAVYDLLRYAEKEHYQQQLTEMWEAWITNPCVDGYNADQRGEMLAAYKYLNEFLKRITL